MKSSLTLSIPFLLFSIFISSSIESFISEATHVSELQKIESLGVKRLKKEEIFETHVSKSIKIESLGVSNVILSGNSYIFSENKTFQLGFFSPSDQTKWYLGIYFGSIPTPTYVWVANRETPLKNLSNASLEINEEGKLVIKEEGIGIVWSTNNAVKGSSVKLLEQGNLVLIDKQDVIVWQSFDYPTDTWLPGMNLTSEHWLTSWKSSNNPAPGKYSLRLSPLNYGEIALVYNSSFTYWSTGNWTSNGFLNVPEMTIPYIYKFHFVNPFTPIATFGYTEVSLDSGVKPPLTRFHLDVTGELRQFTWSPQTENWNMFWSQPENLCKVYGLCGNMGLCNVTRLLNLNHCKCLIGFKPMDTLSWETGDFSSGCVSENDESCQMNDGFEEGGMVNYDGASVVSFSGSRSVCETTCLSNCSCIGLHHNGRTNLCKNLFGMLLNLRNLTSDSTIQEMLYVRVGKNRDSSSIKKIRTNKLLLIGIVSGAIVFLLLLVVAFLVFKRGVRRREKEEESEFPVTNLKVFSYKELQSATKGFSEKVGHGGFGSVFRGELLDSSVVAVKRLERPGGGEKEFRAEVCTIGNIQHVNLVRLRGFCSENSHRLLVYDYMPNGPLSAFLKRGGQNLAWDVRFHIAVGTARGIAYLHEECRNCIIHCDIKPENILIDEDFAAKVSDFGLAKHIGRDFSRILATMRGTWGYVAPEWSSGVAITTKADVYSYGMTLLELIGGRRNVEAQPASGVGGGGGGDGGGKDGKDEKWFFPPWAARQIIDGNVAAVIDERLDGLYDKDEARRLGLVAIWCIQDEEAMRPTMGMVVKMLEGVVEVTIPPPPKLIQALVAGESFHGGNRSSHDSGSSSDDDNVKVKVKNCKDSTSSI